MRNHKPLLWMIIPCYNEEDVLPVTAPMFLEELRHLQETGRIDPESRILFVNDGSKDRTWQIISDLAGADRHYIGISQSRNRGHQNAVLAGLMEARDKCDITISIDCDGQDDVHAMDAMVDAYLDGCEIVYGVRSNRDSDTWFKRTTAQGFYKFLNRMGAEVVYNHADYRLASRRVLEHFADYHEVNLYLRGMFPLIGFKSTNVTYERHERLAGESHYPLKKMIGLALNGITSLSVKPITMIGTTGAVMMLIGLVLLIVAIALAATGSAGAATSLILGVVILTGGLIMMSLGIVGDYVGKTYMESKHRPRYIISERTWETDDGEDRENGTARH